MFLKNLDHVRNVFLIIRNEGPATYSVVSSAYKSTLTQFKTKVYHSQID